MNFHGKYAWESARGVCCFISFINSEYVSSESGPVLASAAPIQESEALMQLLEVREGSVVFCTSSCQMGRAVRVGRGVGRLSGMAARKLFFPSDKSES